MSRRAGAALTLRELVAFWECHLMAVGPGCYVITATGSSLSAAVANALRKLAAGRKADRRVT